MKKKKSFIKKFLCLFAIIFTFGLCFITSVKCASYENAVNCDFVNRLTGISIDGTHLNLYINNESKILSSGRYLIQMFHKDALQTPVPISNLSKFSSVELITNSGSTIGCTSYTSNNRFGYYTSSSLNNANYFRINFTASWDWNIDDYVFNITYNSSTSSFLDCFCPNTYYNVGGENNLGVFQYFRVELWQQYVSTTGGEDISSQSLDFNKVQFQPTLVQRIYNVNDNNGYQYYIRVYFNNAQLDFLPMLYTRYLELDSIMANNTLYTTYASARSSLSWLGTNVVLYGTHESLFKSENDKYNARFDTIQYIQFRIADYTFKSSSYYQSSVGIRGYLSNTYLTSLEDGEVLIANQSYANGKNNGYIEGYNDGFNRATTSGNTSFGSLMLSVADVPIHILYSILNFNILGTNVASLFFAILSLFMFIWLIRRLKE